MHHPHNSLADAFPSPIKDYIRHYAKTENVAESLVATIALTAMSVASQQAVRIENENGSQQPVSLFMQVIAKSSAGKTSTFQNIINPLKNVLESKNKKVCNLHIEHEASVKIWKIQEQALQKEIRKAIAIGQDPGEYKQRYSEILKQFPVMAQSHTLYITAGSSEGIEDYLVSNNGCGLWVHDETLTHVTPRSMAQQIQLFDGSPVTVSLRSRKKVELAHPAMTMLYMSQPTPFEDYISSKTGKLARSKGYEARKLTDWSDDYQRPFHRTSPWNSLAYDPKKFEVLLADKFEESLQISRPRIIKLSESAKNSLYNIKTDIQHTVATDLYASQISDIANKGVQQIIRIAGILHYMDTNSDGISTKHIECARHIYLHYINGAQNFYALDHQPPGHIADAMKLYQFLDDYFKQPHQTGGQISYITINNVKAYGPFKAHNTSRLWTALELLQEQKIIFIQENGVKSKIFFHGKPSHYHTKNFISYQPII